MGSVGVEEEGRRLRMDHVGVERMEAAVVVVLVDMGRVLRIVRRRARRQGVQIDMMVGFRRLEGFELMYRCK